jgi:signal transduction histidine kinase
MLAVPLLGSRRVHGVLAAARLNGRPGFTATDLDMAASFANHAALAIELAEARAHQQMTALLDDRERIAADLHDHVVQPLFGTGLSLQGLAASARQSPMAPRLTAAVADLDRVIAQIRSTIFQLQSSPPAEGPGVRGRLVDVLAEARPALGLEPALRFAGALEEVPPGIVDDLLAVLREALIDVARHAGARTVEVDVAATGDRVTLRVTDDGRGLDDPVHRRSLSGIRRRAEDWGGECEVTPGTSSGTALCWSVPLG